MAKSVRFVCALSHGEYRLISRKDVQMTAFPGDGIINGKHPAGSWIELRSKEGKTLYTRIIHDQPDEHVEVRSDSPDKPLSWQKAKGFERIITFLVPALENADHLLILRRKKGEERKDAVEVGRFPVKY